MDTEDAAMLRRRFAHGNHDWLTISSGGIALHLAACTALIDVESYEFARPDAALASPAIPQGPRVDGGQLAPRPPGALDPVGDAGSAIPGQGVSPVAQDAGLGGAGAVVDPAPPELPRPVVVAEPPAALVALAGNPMGGQPRTAICAGGVLGGLFFQVLYERRGESGPALLCLAPVQHARRGHAESAGRRGLRCDVSRRPSRRPGVYGAARE